MRISYKKRTRFLIIACLIFALLAGCGKDDPEPTSENTPQTNPTEASEHNTDWEKELQDYLQTATLKDTTNAVLHTGQKGNYMELHLQKGETIDVLQKSGYDLIAYENSDGTKYVDADGHVLKEYIGNNILLLRASFTAQDFTVRFFRGSERTTELNAIICAFDKPITTRDLHIGKVIGDECIIGFTDKNGNNVINADQKNVYIDDLGPCVNYSTNTVDLYMKTTSISFHRERLDTYEVSNDGFLKQSLNSAGDSYDVICIPDYTDLTALKALEYKNVTIKVETEIRASKGKQGIRILTAWPEEKKELDDVTIFDSEKIDLANKDGKLMSYDNSVTIPIDQISDTIYIAYNAEGIKSSWKSECLSVTITFS